jgi:replicative DNA helicase
MSRTPPHDLDAETAVLGAVLVSPRVLADITSLTASDFYRPTHADAYAAILQLHAQGEPIDVVSVAGRSSMGMTATDLMHIQGSVGSVGAAVKHSRTLIELALRRKAIALASEIITTAYDDNDPTAVIEQMSRASTELVLPLDGRAPRDLHWLMDFLDRKREEIPGGEWAIPGLLRRTWRAVFVAQEGAGKSVLLRQLAILPAQGIHPFTFAPIPPVRTLIVDAENPAEVIDHQALPIVARLKSEHQDTDKSQAWLWHRPQGIDVRNRSSLAELEAAIAHAKPALVCMGPIYKLFRTGSGENYEHVAGEVQGVLDDLRTRYRFALVLEHHAPKASGGSKRTMDPSGASLWLRWSEFGITLRPTEVRDGRVQELELGRFRYDRIPAAWPTKLTRGLRYPWEATWPDGTFANTEEPF